MNSWLESLAAELLPGWIKELALRRRGGSAAGAEGSSGETGSRLSPQQDRTSSGDEAAPPSAGGQRNDRP